MPPDASEGSARYLISSHRVEEALRRARGLLLVKAQMEPDPAETAMLYARIAQYDADISNVVAERLAFLAEMIALSGPTDSQFQTIQALAAGIDGLTANGNSANDILLAVANILEAWGQAHA
jgi:hypothetical protein